jgi:hypothetical protein
VITQEIEDLIIELRETDIRLKATSIIIARLKENLKDEEEYYHELQKDAKEVSGALIDAILGKE